MKLILGVEDKKKNAKALRRILNSEMGTGYKIVGNYEDARAEIDRGLYDGALVDMMMPKGGELDEHEGLTLFRSVINVIGDDAMRDYFNRRSILSLEQIRLPGICRDYEGSGTDHETKYDQLLGCIREGVSGTGVLPFGVYIIEALEAEGIPGVVVSDARHFVDPLFSFIGGRNGIRLVSSEDFGSKADSRIWAHAYKALVVMMEKGRKPSRNP